MISTMRVTCLKGCCQLEIVPYLPGERVRWSQVPKRRKAGVFTTESTTGKILLVQSRGKLWGPPKGSMDPEETPETAAVRELREETGVILPESELDPENVTRLRTRTVYYHYTLPSPTPVTVQNIPGNDANGVGWIARECAVELAETGRIQLSTHTIKLLQRMGQ